jgi:hypothetical protein
MPLKQNKLHSQSGGTYKPAEYHGANSGRYTATPSGLTTGAYGPQVAVSHGVIHDGVAGPNLAWSAGQMMTGGARKSSRSTQRRRKHSRKTTSKKYKKHRKAHQHGTSCGSSSRPGW